MNKLYTIGYQGRTVDGLIGVIMLRNCLTLIDVRMNPQSRIKGMSKGPLMRDLEQAGYNYIHLPELGVPLAFRGFKQAEYYYKHNVLPAAEGILELIRVILCSRSVLLLCMERDYRNCHRQWIAEKLVKMDSEIKVEHL